MSSVRHPVYTSLGFPSRGILLSRVFGGVGKRSGLYAVIQINAVDIYKSSIRPLLFSVLQSDPEQLHGQAIDLVKWLNTHQQEAIGHWLTQRLHQLCCFDHPSLHQKLWGLDFRNPLGLAAGFDKDGVAAHVWSHFGFGSAELGTVTFHAQPGNPQPRLFRLPPDQAILNRMGFNNAGAAALAERLSGDRMQQSNDYTTEAQRTQRTQGTQGTQKDQQPALSSQRFDIPIGINLGKSKITPLEAAAADYVESFRLLKALGDYFVVNVSSPNTPGLRSLQATEQLAPILTALQQENCDRKPLLVKIAPDLAWEEIEAIIALVEAHDLAGIIATNTTIDRQSLKTRIIQATGNSVTDEAGGISGAPVRQRATEVIRFIHQSTQGKIPIIGVGGVFTAEHAWEKITAGASLVQVYTGWIYEGPFMMKRVLQGLAAKLEAEGLSHIEEAIGIQAN